jgi:hypothetical protein
MRDESGLTLVELLVAASLMIVVMIATLTAVEAFQLDSNATQTQNESQEAARVAVGKLARELRNGAASAAGSDNSIGRATATEFVFQAVDETGASGGLNVRHSQWVRYCLDSSNPDDGRIWRQTFTWTGATAPAVPFATSCPDTGTGARSIVAGNIVNGDTAPLFRFNPPLGAEATGVDYAQITHVTIDVLVNADPARQRKATRLTSGVYLRNQADPPTARFEQLVAGDGTVYLNASPSSDPRGASLTYRWCDTTGGAVCSEATAIGQGLTLRWEAPSGTRAITLSVTNAAGVSDSETQEVEVP